MQKKIEIEKKITADAVYLCVSCKTTHAHTHTHSPSKQITGKMIFISFPYPYLAFPLFPALENQTRKMKKKEKFVGK